MQLNQICLYKNSKYWLLLMLLSCTNCANPVALADEVCDCVKKANTNAIELAKCYNHSRAIKEQKLFTQSDKTKFDNAILTCLGGSVIQKMFQ
jgi:hypothetical protein